MNRILALLTAIRDNNAGLAERVAASYTRQERAILANGLEEAATFLKRYNKAWDEALNYPAENEE